MYSAGLRTGAFLDGSFKRSKSSPVKPADNATTSLHKTQQAKSAVIKSKSGQLCRQRQLTTTLPTTTSKSGQLCRQRQLTTTLPTTTTRKQQENNSADNTKTTRNTMLINRLFNNRLFNRLFNRHVAPHCPVCWEPTKGANPHQCRNGHIICSGCSVGVQQCYSCGVAMDPANPIISIAARHFAEFAEHVEQKQNQTLGNFVLWMILLVLFHEVVPNFNTFNMWGSMLCRWLVHWYKVCGKQFENLPQI